MNSPAREADGPLRGRVEPLEVIDDDGDGLPLGRSRQYAEGRSEDCKRVRSAGRTEGESAHQRRRLGARNLGNEISDRLQELGQSAERQI